MRRVFCAISGLCIAIAALSPSVACDNSSAIYEPPGVEPQRVRVVGPAGGGLHCRPAETGGNCPLPLKLTFQLPPGEFIAKAIVTFQGDGSDTGVDRYYAVPYTYGQGDGVDVSVDLEADIPTTILRENALFTYTVTLITGAGAHSTATTLNVSVT